MQLETTLFATVHMMHGDGGQHPPSEFIMMPSRLLAPAGQGTLLPAFFRGALHVL
jgi:hypothetical protein